MDGQAQMGQHDAETMMAQESSNIAIDEAGTTLDSVQRQVIALQDEAASARKRVRTMALALAAAEAKLARSERRGAVLAESFAAADLELRAIRASTTWKLAGLLQQASVRHPRVAGLGFKCLRVAWWTARGTLVPRLRGWSEARLAPTVKAQPLPIVVPGNIVIPRHEQPIASIIIPGYGNVDYTLRCLASIAANAPVAPFEVIVAEDASGDPAVARLREVANLKLIENPENLGFIRSCNAAVRHATGEFVMFLNNDTEVCEGWLDTLVGLLQRRTDAGAAGSKLLYPDGRLQEAGGIVWDDGSGWNFGRLDDPTKAVYNYVREVDYVSGAALMVRRALFDELNGFDTHYAPAYCEDSDLGFRIRAKGLKVLYQPRSQVIHHEGVSNGTDLATGVKASQVQNQRKLAGRWREVMAREHFPPGTHVLRARDHSRARRVVLVIDHYVPQPDRDAGSRTMFTFIQVLLQEGMTVKFWPDSGCYLADYTEMLQDMGVEVCYGASAGSFDDWIAVNGPDLDAVLLSRPTVSAKYIQYLWASTSATLIFYGHDLHFARMRAQAELTGDAAMAQAADEMQRAEIAIWQQSDVVLYPSAEEASVVAAMAPETPVRAVVPFAFEHFAEPRSPVPGVDLLFVAGFAHPPNEDAALWFSEEIFPIIRKTVPSAHLILAGSNPTQTVSSLAGQHVSVQSNLSDAELAALYRRARVAVVPLRFGAGVKLKVVEALRDGVPLVTTPVGVQGCAGLDGVVAVHSDPADFAQAVCRLLTDDTAWATASEQQIAFAKENFSLERLRSALLLATDL